MSTNRASPMKATIPFTAAQQSYSPEPIETESSLVWNTRGAILIPHTFLQIEYKFWFLHMLKKFIITFPKENFG
jgi:hypothetical protein